MAPEFVCGQHGPADAALRCMGPDPRLTLHPLPDPAPHLTTHPKGVKGQFKKVVILHGYQGSEDGYRRGIMKQWNTDTVSPL